jgi:hypothetical protein
MSIEVRCSLLVVPKQLINLRYGFIGAHFVSTRPPRDGGQRASRVNRAFVLIGAGAVAGLLMWLFARLGTQNLRPSVAVAVQLILVCWAIVCGLATGVLVNRRRGRTDEVLFAVTAGAVGGALCGAAYAIALGVTYVATFGGSPVDFSDAAILLISYPVFAALGALVGTVPGALLGLGVGFLIQRLPAPQPQLSR